MKITHPKTIRFQCVECGICCADTLEHTREIRVTRGEAERISNEVGLKVSDFAIQTTNAEPYPLRMKKNDGKCFFLDNDRCMIYEARPLTCRFYPFSMVQLPRRIFVFDAFLNECPGIGKGSRLDRSFFETLLSEAVKELRPAA